MKIKTDERGVASLAELMIAMGLTGVLAVGAMAVSSFALQSSQRVQTDNTSVDQGTQSLEAVVQRVMLAPRGVFPNAAGAPVNLPFSISPDQKSVQYVSSQYSTNANQVVETIALIGDRVVYQVPGLPDVTIASNVSSLAFANVPGTGSIVRLQVNITMATGQSYTTSVTPRDQNSPGGNIN